jgi:hypothetical protein
MSESYDPERTRAALIDAVGCAFADMAFIDIEPLPDEVPAAPLAGQAPAAPGQAEREIRVAIDILRPMSARLELRLPESLRARVLEILCLGGEDPAATPRDDSILELLNVIAGQFISRYFPPKTDIKLELPQYLFFHAADEGETIRTVRFDAEGLGFEATLYAIRYRY